MHGSAVPTAKGERRRERESEFLSQQVYDGMLERERERREGGMVGWF